jgi:hypothetical protein
VNTIDVQILTDGPRDGEWITLPRHIVQSGRMNIPRMTSSPASWLEMGPELEEPIDIVVEHWTIEERTREDGLRFWVMIDPALKARLVATGLHPGP